MSAGRKAIIIMMMLLCSGCSTSQPEQKLATTVPEQKTEQPKDYWEFIDEAVDGSKVYYTEDGTIVKGNVVTGTVLYAPPSTNNRVLKSLFITQVNCEGRRSRTLKGTMYFYTGQTASIPISEEWEQINPNSVGKKLFDRMCRAVATH